MDPSPNSSRRSVGVIRDTIIQPGDSVLLKLPNGDLRSVKVDKDAYGLVPKRHHNVLILFQYDHSGKSGFIPSERSD